MSHSLSLVKNKCHLTFVHSNDLSFNDVFQTIVIAWWPICINFIELFYYLLRCIGCLYAATSKLFSVTMSILYQEILDPIKCDQFNTNLTYTIWKSLFHILFNRFISVGQLHICSQQGHTWRLVPFKSILLSKLNSKRKSCTSKIS